MDTINIDVEKLNINKDMFMKHVYDNALNIIKSDIKSDYLKNKKNYNTADKNAINKIYSTLSGGKIYDKKFDSYTYLLLNMYDVVDNDTKEMIKLHIQKKLNKNQRGGVLDFDGFIADMNSLSDTIKDTTITEEQKYKALVDLQQMIIKQQQIMAENGNINGIPVASPLVRNIFDVSNLKDLSADDIVKKVDEQTISSLYFHLGNLTNIKTVTIFKLSISF